MLPGERFRTSGGAVLLEAARVLRRRERELHGYSETFSEYLSCVNGRQGRAREEEREEEDGNEVELRADKEGRSAQTPGEGWRKRRLLLGYHLKTNTVIP